MRGPLPAYRGRSRRIRWLVVPFLLPLLFPLLALLAPNETPESAEVGAIHVLTVEGVINPVTARYLARTLDEAANTQAGLVVINLNTPGGLESTTREIVQRFLSSPVPVAVYVSPPGARAASAGMFITIAANVAAMAPGTNVGAAHPVGLGGETDPVAAEKLVNDTAALARGIADVRGRNAEWCEAAVRESVSATAEEALALGVIDLVAADFDTLLGQLDGRVVTTPVGERALDTVGAQVVERPMTLPERIVHTITDPNIAYILFTIGVIGIVAELLDPGALFPGIVGGVALILAFVAFGNLPVSWAGIILIALAIGLFIADLSTEGIGVLAALGLVAFVLGSLLLYTPVAPTSPAMPEVRVSPWLVAAMALIFGGFFVVALRALLRARRAPVTTGIEALVGQIGTATSSLTPAGVVRLDGENWSAVSVEGNVRAGESVEVVGVAGVSLRVRRHEA